MCQTMHRTQKYGRIINITFPLLLQIENQKKALEKKDKELETLTKQNTGMRDTIERMDREKLLLNTKLKNALKLNSKAHNKNPKGYTDTQIYTQVQNTVIHILHQIKSCYCFIGVHHI